MVDLVSQILQVDRRVDELDPGVVVVHDRCCLGWANRLLKKGSVPLDTLIEKGVCPFGYLLTYGKKRRSERVRPLF